MITLEQAQPEDAETLAEVQTRTFDDDARQHGRGERGGPPGYDSTDWQTRMMREAAYYKILDDEKIVGGAIIFDKGSDHIYLGRIYIDPDYQNRRIGAEAMRLIEACYPAARRWTLETPQWALRNQHFYERQGYIKVGEQWLEGEDHGDVLYEKLLSSE